MLNPMGCGVRVCSLSTAEKAIQELKDNSKKNVERWLSPLVSAVISGLVAFIFVKVGYERPTGIVGVGYFTSDPYIDGDWSGQGRTVHYMDMDWETVINPTSDKILKVHELIKNIPEIMWSKGKAGVMVAPEVGEKIESLWNKHVETIK